jgi:hypothetical protein
MLFLILILVTVAAFARLLRRAIVENPPVRCRGWLDDDGAPRGERWDGSPLRPALAIP